MDATPTPIFVIGMNRTGTKWLSNLLANHPDVAAVQHQDHTGILETNAFDAWPQKFPDLSLDDEYTALAELWSRTDFFRITEADPDFFHRLRPRPGHPVDMLRALMDDLAKRTGRPFWLQKVSPWSAREVFRRFPNARLAAIVRDRMDTLRSTHYLVTQGAHRIPFKTIVSHHLQERLLEQARRRGAAFVRYEDLRTRPEEELARVCTGLGLRFDPRMLELPWERNTSFRTGNARGFSFSASERRRIRLLGAVVGRLPDFALAGTRALFRTRFTPVVGGTFRRLRREQGEGVPDPHDA